ncbi:NADP-dependent oxidoreductase domain-containing protein [Irpex rosettiformis]|uniref:NADP-dependent oxidoreductase domain-containing protein n=1 Tax=Irpex rosettiformis TaxID=378272 RepID=A0ACB8UAJ2_9APHY|nr:NADP-dependent oxidoreductase domain-containing protein [Irpex rosettiformis]
MASSLSTRKIGNDSVTAIGFGAMSLSAFYGTPKPDEERLKFLDHLYASGCRNWDTANTYGDSELLIGEWFERTGKRGDIFLATKFGIALSEETGRPVGVNGKPEYCKAEIEKSLARLGVDYVDLYYLHRPDTTVPIEKTVGAMADLVKAGKVRYLGLSECSASTLRRAYAVHPISAIQVEYSIFTLDIENPRIDLLRTARELGVSIVAYSPLGRGMLTGRIKSPDSFEPNDFRKALPRFSAENFPKVTKAVDAVAVIARKHNATPGQVALAWLLAQGDDIIPIPGTTKVENLDENLGAMKLKLTDDDVLALRKLAEDIEGTLGERNVPISVKMLFADTPPLA